MAGSTFIACITNVESNGPLFHIWGVNPEDKRTSTIDIHLNNFKSIFESSKFGVVSPDILTLNEIVCVKVNDQWFRGEIENIDLSRGVADIYFIDIGNKKEVKVENIRSLTTLRGAPLASTTPLATKYTLAGVRSLEESWNPNLIFAIKKNYSCKSLIFKEEIKGYVSVSYMDGTNDLSSLLLSLNYAEAISVTDQQVLAIALGSPIKAVPDTLDHCELPKEFEFRKPNVFEVGSEHIVTVTSIDSGPNLFHVQLCHNEHMLKDMMTQLNMQELQPFCDMPVPGTGCAAKCVTDDSLCRGIIMEMMAKDQKCKVLLIDFGLIQIVSPQYLYELPLKFQLIKPIATQFSLKGSNDLPDYTVMTNWFKESVTNKRLKMIVSPKPETGSMWKQYCDLYFDNVSVLTMLKERIRKEGGEYKSIRLEENMEYQCCITYVDDSGTLPWTFCIQLMSNTELLRRMMHEVAEYCQMVAATDLGHVGDPVFARYSIDKMWYRCKIKEKKASSAVVEFVDYGEIEEIGVLNLRPMLPELISALPAQAVTCRLQNADTQDNMASKFRELTYSKVVNVKVVKHLAGGDTLVRVYDNSTSPTDLAYQLLLNNAPACQIEQIVRSSVPSGFQQVTGKPNITSRSTACEAPNMREVAAEEEMEETPRMTKVAVKHYASKMDERWFETKHVVTSQINTGERQWEHDKYRKENKTEDRISDSAYSSQRTGSERPYNGREDHQERLRQERSSFSRDQTRNNFQRDEDQSKNHHWNQKNSSDNYGRQKQKDWEDTTDHISVKKEENVKSVNSWNSDKPKKSGDYGSGFRMTAGGDAPNNNKSKFEEAPIPKMRFTPLSVLPGDKLGVFITYLVNPSNLYVQLDSNYDTLLNLMEEIRVMCDGSKSDSHSQLSQLEPPDACLAKFKEDSIWYRAQVISVNGDKVKVKFVDYGNVVDVEVSDLKLMTSELLTLPMQAINCSLRGVKPAGQEWSKEQLNIFSQVEDICIQAEVVGLEGLRLRHYSVVLHNKGTCLNTEMGASPESLLPCTSLPVSDLAQDCTHDVVISWFLTPDNFHITLNDSRQERDYMYAEFSDMECPSLQSVEAGQLVLAHKNKDYFRGKILATRDTKARVMNLDIGNIQVCEVKELRVMPESLKSMPAFAVPCAMFGITPKTGPEWPRNSAAINAIFQSSPNFTLSVQAKHESGKLLVSLQAAGKDVAKTLVEQELASKIVTQDEAVEEKLSPGHTCKVLVCYINGLDKFYLQEQARLEALDVMQEDLQQVELSGTPDPSSTIFAARDVEGGMFRAKLVSNNKVFFVDFGHVDPCNEMFPLPAKFCAIPYFATECRLAIQPLAGHTWPQQAIDKFESLVFEDNVSARVLAKYQGCLLVDLIVNGDKSVIDSMVQEKLAQPMMCDVYFSNVESPSQFYVQQVKDEAKLYEIENRLGTEEFEDADTLEVGMKCIAKFSADDAWYRAQVLSINDGVTNVQFMDYGNCAEASEFKKLPSDMLNIDALAKLCSLAAKPVSEEERQKFLDTVIDGTVKFQVLYVDSQQTPAQVIVLRDGKNIQVQEEVIANVCPVKAGSKLTQQQNVEPILQRVTETKQTLSENVTENEQPVSQIIPETPTHNLTNVYISYYASPTEFYYQKVEDEAKIFALQEQVSLLEQDFTDTVTVGAMYAAQFTADNSWYRGVVVSINPTLVYFIDFGNTGNAVELKVLPQDMEDLPAFAHSHALHFSPSDTSIQDKLKEILSDECTVFQLDHTGRVFIDGKDIFEIVGYSMTDVFVSYVESTQKFYIQRNSDLDKVEEVQANLEAGEDLILVEQGMKCAAKFIDDDNWYRAIITSKQDEIINVFFYDYGNSAIATQFKILPECVLGIPFLAQECHLDNVTHLSDKAEEKLSVLLEEVPVFQAYIPQGVKGESAGVCLMCDGKNITHMVEETKLCAEEKCLKRINCDLKEHETCMKKARTEEDATENLPKTSEVLKSEEKVPEIISNVSEPLCEFDSVVQVSLLTSEEQNTETIPELHKPANRSLDPEISFKFAEPKIHANKSEAETNENQDDVETTELLSEDKFIHAEINFKFIEPQVVESVDKSVVPEIAQTDLKEKNSNQADTEAAVETQVKSSEFKENCNKTEPENLEYPVTSFINKETDQTAGAETAIFEGEIKSENADLNVSNDNEEQVSVFYSDSDISMSTQVEVEMEEKILVTPESPTVTEPKTLSFLMEASINLQMYQEQTSYQSPHQDAETGDSSLSPSDVASEAKSTPNDVASEAKATPNDAASEAKASASDDTSEAKASASDAASEAKASASDAASEAKASASNDTSEAKASASDAASEAKASASDAASEAKASPNDAASKAKATPNDAASEAKASASDDTSEAKASASDAASEAKASASDAASEAKASASDAASEANASASNDTSEAKASASDAASEAKASASDAASEAKASPNDAASEAKASASDAASEAKATPNDAASEAKASASDAASQVKATPNDAASEVKASASDAASEAKATPHDAASQVKATPHDAASEAKASASDAASEAKATPNDAASEAKATPYDAASEAKASASDAASEAKSTPNDAASEAKASASDAASQVKATPNDAASEVKASASDDTSEAKASASDAASQVKATPHDAASEAKASASDAASEAKSTPNDAASEVKASASDAASEAKSTPNDAASEAKASASDAASEAKSTPNDAASEAKASASDAASEAKATPNDAVSEAKATPNDVASEVKASASDAASEAKASASDDTSEAKASASDAASEAKASASDAASEAKADSKLESSYEKSVYEDAEAINTDTTTKQTEKQMCDTNQDMDISLYESFTEPEYKEDTSNVEQAYVTATEISTSTPEVTAKPKCLTLSDISPVEPQHSETPE